jgi:hypothetical protein
MDGGTGLGEEGAGDDVFLRAGRRFRCREPGTGFQVSGSPTQAKKAYIEKDGPDLTASATVVPVLDFHPSYRPIGVNPTG